MTEYNIKTKVPKLLKHPARRLKKLVKELDMLPTPDGSSRSANYHPRQTGRTEATADVGICLFAAQLFQINEQLGEPGPYRELEKMSDAEMERQLREKYPDAKLVKRFDHDKCPMTVNQLRQHYNTGRLISRMAVDSPISFRYNALGDRVDGRTGRRALTPTEIEKMIAHYREAREANNIRRATASAQAIEWWYGPRHGISTITYRKRRATKRVLDAVASRNQPVSPKEHPNDRTERKSVPNTPPM